MNRSDAGWAFLNITALSTAAVKKGSGILKAIVINKLTVSGVITIYDSLVGSGTKIGTITNPGTLVQEGPVTATYECAFNNGLTIVQTGGAQDITVVFA